MRFLNIVLGISFLRGSRCWRNGNLFFEESALKSWPMSRKLTKSLGHACGMHDFKYEENSPSTTGDTAENGTLFFNTMVFVIDRSYPTYAVWISWAEREPFEVLLKFLLWESNYRRKFTLISSKFLFFFYRLQSDGCFFREWPMYVQCAVSGKSLLGSLDTDEKLFYLSSKRHFIFDRT